MVERYELLTPRTINTTYAGRLWADFGVEDLAWLFRFDFFPVRQPRKAGSGWPRNEETVKLRSDEQHYGRAAVPRELHV